MPVYDSALRVAQVRQQLGAEEYARGALLVKRQLSPFSRPLSRAGVCAMGACLSASAAPLSLAEYGSMWIPFLFILFFLALAVWLLVMQPDLELEKKKREFSSCPLLGLETTITLYRDFMVLENGYEEILEYWTDYFACFEDESFIAAVGGRERYLLLLKKEGVPPEQRETISAHLSSAFSSRYSLLPQKGGRRDGTGKNS